MQREIVLPITEPETEWVRGRARQKVSSTFDHGRVQFALASSLDAWAQGRGRVVPEWRFRLAVPGEPRRPLVPDVAFVAASLLEGVSREDRQSPSFAPTVAVEVLSPGDARADVEHKIAVYLAAGTKLVIVADPKRRTLALHDPFRFRTLSGDDTFAHDALPGLSFHVGRLFSAALD